MSANHISELGTISYLKGLARRYESETGTAPFELSHWDPSEETARELLRHLSLPPAPPTSPYIYSYYLDVQEQILRRLGVRDKSQTCLFVHAGTSAILFAAWWLKSLKISRVVVLCPTYFPVFYSAQMMGLDCLRVYMRRRRGMWQLPREEVTAAVREAPSATAVWVINPTFCTGSYFDEADVEFLNTLLGQGVAVVADECLAMNGMEVGGRLRQNGRLLSLYSPHKAVCLNAVKFAALVFHVEHRLFFEEWTDVLVGGLSSSSYTAILHFLGDNFAHYQSAFMHRVEAAREMVLRIIGACEAGIESDENPVGYFMSCYAPAIPGDAGSDEEFLRRLVFDTGALVIPGVRNHFDPRLGFNFRVNLARACPQFYASLHRVCDFLAGAG